MNGKIIKSFIIAKPESGAASFLKLMFFTNYSLVNQILFRHLNFFNVSGIYF